jgi:hypothetical protein
MQVKIKGRAKSERPQIIDHKRALANLERLTQRIADGQEGDARDYANLQYTWNKEILARALPFIPAGAKQAIGIGSFQGALEMALAPYMDRVLAVDHESFLPDWKPENVVFHRANIDSNEWELPEDTMFDVSFCIETIEHLLWSPLPLLTWMKTYSHVAIISTPDDAEWPAMPIRPWTRYTSFRNIPAAAPGVGSNPMPMHHCKQYKQAEFIEMLDFVGFRLVEFFRVGDGKHQMVAVVQPR